MVLGAKQRIVNQNWHDYAMSKATVPVALVNDNPTDKEISDAINKQQETLNNINDPNYQQKQVSTAKRNKKAISLFDQFSSSALNQKGG